MASLYSEAAKAKYSEAAKARKASSALVWLREVFVDDAQDAVLIAGEGLGRAPCMDVLLYDLPGGRRNLGGVELKGVAGDGGIVTEEVYFDVSELCAQGSLGTEVFAFAASGGEASGFRTA
jgi:hypothetical protein